MTRYRRRRDVPTGEFVSQNGHQQPIADESGVGKRLRLIRTRQGFSIRALAEASQLSVNTLSLIENGKTSPSVSTLLRVAQALSVPITRFFEEAAEPSRVVFAPAALRRSVIMQHGTLEDMGAGLPDRTVQPFLITLDPDSGSGPDDIVHTGHEFIYCLSGCLTYYVDGHTYVLSPSDSLVFESHLPHHWYNAGAVPMQALLILYPSERRDRPTDRHFSLLDKLTGLSDGTIALGETQK